MATNISEWRDEIREDVDGCPVLTMDKKIVESVRKFCQETRCWTEQLAPIDVVALQRTDIAFVSGSPCTITTTGGDFSTAGFTAADQITTDSELNPGPYTIDTGGVASGTLTLVATDDLVSESANSFTVAKNLYPLTTSSGDIINVTEPIEFVSNDDGGRYDVYPTSTHWLAWNCAGWERHTGSFPTRYLMGDNLKLRLYPMCIESRTNALNVEVTLKPGRTATSVEDFIYNDYMEVIADGAKARLLKMRKMPWFDMASAQDYKFEFDKGLDKVFNTVRSGRTDMVQGGVSA